MVHSTVVCLPYDPLRCLPLNAVCMSAVETIPHSTTVLMSVQGSTQPICIVYFMVQYLYSCLLHSGFHCGMDSTVACAWLVYSNSYELPLCPIFCHRVHYIAAYLMFCLLYAYSTAVCRRVHSTVMFGLRLYRQLARAI